MAYSQRHYSRYQLIEGRCEELASIFNLGCEPGINYVRGGHAKMDKTALWPQLFLNRTQERDQIMMGLLLNLLHTLGIIVSLAYLDESILRNNAFTSPAFAGQ